ncbi:MAG TPA: hypothetical protein VH413_00070 [Verrucomicrobiae bacterium]|jgi:hypothetical protein|nr:hypothetical protein [Verrucomicrobiae bacterium]
MKKIILLSLLLTATAVFTGCQSTPDNASYVSQEFPPAQLVKQPNP